MLHTCALGGRFLPSLSPAHRFDVVVFTRTGQTAPGVIYPPFQAQKTPRTSRAPVKIQLPTLQQHPSLLNVSRLPHALEATGAKAYGLLGLPRLTLSLPPTFEKRPRLRCAPSRRTTPIVSVRLRPAVNLPNTYRIHVRPCVPRNRIQCFVTGGWSADPRQTTTTVFSSKKQKK